MAPKRCMYYHLIHAEDKSRYILTSILKEITCFVLLVLMLHSLESPRKMSLEEGLNMVCDAMKSLWKLEKIGNAHSLPPM